MAERSRPAILLIEDNVEDYEVAQRILQRVTDRPILHCADGDSALDYLQQCGTFMDTERAALCPALILLDLNLPATDGREVLRQIKQDTRLQTIPVVIFTTSARLRDVNLCYQLGANSYVVKPVDFQRLTRVLELLAMYWTEVVTLSAERSL